MGQMMQMPMQMAQQAAQIPMQLAGMAAAIPQAMMQGVQSAMQQTGQISEMSGEEREAEEQEAQTPEEATRAAPTSRSLVPMRRRREPRGESGCRTATAEPRRRRPSAEARAHAAGSVGPEIAL